MNFWIFERVITSAKVQVAFTAATVAGMVLFGVPPDKQLQAVSFIAGIFTLATAVVVALGFQDVQKEKTAQATIQATAGVPRPLQYVSTEVLQKLIAELTEYNKRSIENAESTSKTFNN